MFETGEYYLKLQNTFLQLEILWHLYRSNLELFAMLNMAI